MKERIRRDSGDRCHQQSMSFRDCGHFPGGCLTLFLGVAFEPVGMPQVYHSPVRGFDLSTRTFSWTRRGFGKRCHASSEELCSGLRPIPQARLQIPRDQRRTAVRESIHEASVMSRTYEHERNCSVVARLPRRRIGIQDWRTDRTRALLLAIGTPHFSLPGVLDRFRMPRVQLSTKKRVSGSAYGPRNLVSSGRQSVSLLRTNRIDR